MSLNKHQRDQRIYDPIRQTWVDAFPEEIVRQDLIHHLIHDLGFPQSLISLEKQIKEIPHLQNTANVPNRRVDILCYAKDIHPEQSLYPLLLIECKSIVSLTETTWRQIRGYNYYIRAPFLALVNAENKRFTWQGSKAEGVKVIDFIPQYSELVNALLS